MKKIITVALCLLSFSVLAGCLDLSPAEKDPYPYGCPLGCCKR